MATIAITSSTQSMATNIQRVNREDKVSLEGMLRRESEKKDSKRSTERQKISGGMIRRGTGDEFKKKVGRTPSFL